MSFKTTILLVGLLVLIGVIWLFFPKHEAPVAEPPTAARAEEAKNVFDPAPKEDQIVRVELARAGKPRIAFERAADGESVGRAADNWRMTEPVQSAVEGYKVTGLLGVVTTLQARASFEPGAPGQVSAADAGLEPPATVLTLTDKEGKTYGLEIGKKAPMSSDTYVRRAGEKLIHLATRDLAPQVEKNVNDFRAQRLLRAAADEITRVRIEREKDVFDFSRHEAGEWVVNEPLRTRADGTKIREKLLTPLTTLNVAAFVDDAPDALDRFGLAEPHLTLTVTTEKKRRPPATQPTDTQPEAETVVETQRLLVGDFADLKSERRYVKLADAPWVATANQSALGALVPNLSELRDPRVLRLKAGDVTELELASGGLTATLKKQDDVWRGTGDLTDVDAQAVGELLSALESLSAVSYVDQPEAPAQYGLDRPRATLKASVVGAVGPVVLHIGATTASGRNAYVQREGEAPVIVVAEAQATKLALSPVELRSRTVFAFAPEQLANVQVERGRSRYELVRDGSAWKLAQPANAPADLGNTQNLANDLARLRAQRVIAKGDASKYGLDQPAAVIRFEVTEPTATTGPAEASVAPQRHTLYVAQKDNVAYARRDEDPYVFAIDDTVYRVLTAELIDARLFLPLKAEDIVYIKVVAPAGTLELARAGKEWSYVPDVTVALAQAKIDEFARDIAQMRAESFVDYANADLAAAGLLQPSAVLTLKTADGREIVMNMIQEATGQLPRRAGLVAERRTFLLRNADVEKLMRGLDAYVKVDAPATQPVTPPRAPGLEP